MRMRPSSSTTRNSSPLSSTVSLSAGSVSQRNVAASLSRQACRAARNRAGSCPTRLFVRSRERPPEDAVFARPARGAGRPAPTARQRPCGVDPRRVELHAGGVAIAELVERRASSISDPTWGVSRQARSLSGPRWDLFAPEQKSMTRQVKKRWRGASGLDLGGHGVPTRPALSFKPMTVHQLPSACSSGAGANGAG